MNDTVTSIYDAVQSYKEADIPWVVLVGKDYGMGSSRDRAAKGTFLLGVKTVITKSFERIYRSCLVGRGVLPLNFKNGVCVGPFWAIGQHYSTLKEFWRVRGDRETCVCSLDNHRCNPLNRLVFHKVRS